MRDNVPDAFEQHPDLLYQLVTMLSPKVLDENGVGVVYARQRPGDYIVTFPAAYHAGFSHGVNFTEAVNFANVEWLPWGYDAAQRYRHDVRDPLFSHEHLVIASIQAMYTRSMGVMELLALYREFSRILTLEKLQRGRLSKLLAGKHISIVRCIGANQDSIKGRNCSVCKHYLYLSALTCHCDPNKIFCLWHAEAKTCECALVDKQLHIRFTLPELTSQLEILALRIKQVQTQITPQACCPNVSNSRGHQKADPPLKGTKFEDLVC
eukprot:c9236_g1_i1.p1 GENE.c9236_g1_i1~~c9236_g1_i1.p1  ORF type:complete len:266 (-),score=62.46 c9236_g1_i1:26-823(-)